MFILDFYDSPFCMCRQGTVYHAGLLGLQSETCKRDGVGITRCEKTSVPIP